MTAWVFEARHRPTLLNEIKKTKLNGNAEPQAGINILLAAGFKSAQYISLSFERLPRQPCQLELEICPCHI